VAGGCAGREPDPHQPGVKCDVLTVDGTEEILVGPDSIEGAAHPE
jgi:hypothetical protein